MNKIMSRVSVIVVFLVFNSTIFSQNFQTQSVSIFKNGQSFFIKKGKVQPENGTWKMIEQDMPTALFGSLWFHTPTGEIDFTKSYPDTISIKKQEDANGFLDLLKLNQGKQMAIYLKEKQVVSGVLESVTETKKSPNSRLGHGHLLVLKTAESWVSLNFIAVQRIDFLEKPNFTKETIEKLPKNTIEIGFKDKSASQNLEMMYLRNGLQWAPEYLLELKSDTRATLTLQSEIANDGEDLKDIELNLVVGVPNFKFADKSSLLVSFLKEIRQSASRNNLNFIQNSANSFQNVNYGIETNFQGNAAASNSISGSVNEDLFFYTLKDFSLPKGGRAMQELFQEEIDIQHIYEANLPSNPNSYNKEFLFQASDKNLVVHSIKITNKTNQPWTTGSVFVVNQEGKTRPMSQDKLNYTSSKGHSFVKLTESPDVKVTQAEKEISRQARKQQWKNNYWYDLVKVEGQVKIRNFKNKKIDLNVRRSINGILGESNVKWLQEKRVSQNNQFNPVNRVCWEMSLDAGEEVTIMYDYEIFVRH